MKKLTMSMLILALLILSGCFDYDENLVINKDGSGTVEMHYAFDETYLKQMEEMSRQMTQQMGLPAEDTATANEGMFNKAEIEEALKAEGSGVVMTSYEDFVKDGIRHYKLNFTFEDINKLYLLYTAVYPDDEEQQYGNETYSGEEYDEKEPAEMVDSTMPTLYSMQDDGTWLFERQMEGDGSDENMNGEKAGSYGMDDEQGEDYYGEGESDEESSEEIDYAALSELMDDEEMAKALGDLGEQMQGLGAQMENMAEQMGEHHIRFTVKFPGIVIESNATSFEGNTAVWTLKLDQMEEGLSNMRAVVKP